jgi:hypothetical protein
MCPFLLSPHGVSWNIKIPLPLKVLVTVNLYPDYVTKVYVLKLSLVIQRPLLDLFFRSFFQATKSILYTSIV